MIKTPEVGMTVFSVFGILGKEHMYIGEIIEIKPRMAAFKWLDEHPVPVEWEKLPDDIDPFKFFYIDRGEKKCNLI